MENSGLTTLFHPSVQLSTSTLTVLLPPNRVNFGCINILCFYCYDYVITVEAISILWWFFSFPVYFIVPVLNNFLPFNCLVIYTFHKFNPKHSAHCLNRLSVISGVSGSLSVLSFWRTPLEPSDLHQDTLAMLCTWSPASREPNLSDALEPLLLIHDPSFLKEYIVQYLLRKDSWEVNTKDLQVWIYVYTYLILN